MEVIAYIFILGVIGYAGYTYMKHRKAHPDLPTGDDDFVDCQSQARKKFDAGSTDYNADVVGCYINKKTDKVRKLLEKVD